MMGLKFESNSNYNKLIRLNFLPLPPRALLDVEVVVLPDVMKNTEVKNTPNDRYSKDLILTVNCVSHSW